MESQGFSTARPVGTTADQSRKISVAEKSVDFGRHWCRTVMNGITRDWIATLDPSRLKVLEISGRAWEGVFPFHSYRAVFFPEYDVCAGPLDEAFDLVIAEQVFEHLLWPYRAGRHVYQMLKPGGHVLMTTPFLIRVHDTPVDCSRWTEIGLKHLLAECGFAIECIRTGSWGNRDCVIANFAEWPDYEPELHSLENEPNFPLVVWALAQRQSC